MGDTTGVPVEILAGRRQGKPDPVRVQDRSGKAVFEHQVHVLISGSVVAASDALWLCLEVWKLPHLLGKGVRPLPLTPLLCTCCRVLLSFLQKIHPEPDREIS